MYSYNNKRGKTLTCFEDEDISRFFPKRKARTNKGTYGKVLAVCGSFDSEGRSMCGAAYFSAAAAYRTGAGLVQIYTPRENYIPLATLIPEATFLLYDREEPDLKKLGEAVDSADAVIVGCGLGTGENSFKIVRTVFESINSPMIVDADALNILAKNSELWDFLGDCTAIITPHPGEMARLCGVGVEDILSDTVEYCEKLSGDYGVTCVLKDHRSIVSDGSSIFVNESGNPGMATAGSGDVLTGVIAGLFARKGDFSGGGIYKTAAATYIHGRAGDYATRRIGEYSVCAKDILNEIANVISDMSDTSDEYD